MLLQATASIACFLQLCGVAYALPTEQQFLSQLSKDVQAIRSELKKAEIIPTVIDDFLPSLTLSAIWSDNHAKLGNTIKPKHLQEQPSLALHDITRSFESTASDMSYVVTLTDPDAPSRDNPEWSEMCHWIASNVTISKRTYTARLLSKVGLKEQMTSTDGSPDDVIEYKPPGPPPKTGKHRYVFIAFAPKNGTTNPLHLSKPKDRQHWGTGKERGGVRNWAYENGLVPVAANFIYSKNKKQ